MDAVYYWKRQSDAVEKAFDPPFLNGGVEFGEFFFTDDLFIQVIMERVSG